MERVAVVDGALVPEGSAAISPFDRGLLYGEGVFETLRTYRKRVFAWDEHAARLERSAVLLGVAIPCSRAVLESETRAALERFVGGEAIVRLIVTAGDRGAATRVVLVEPFAPAARYDDGVAIVTRKSGALRDAKTTSYLENLLARRAARAESADETVFFDERGELLEGATSNVFVVEGQRLRTPPLDGRILAGVTRAHVLACARRVGLDVDEGVVAATSLASADEAFLTSTLRELLPIARVDGAARAGRGAVTERLHHAFLAAAEASAAAW